MAAVALPVGITYSEIAGVPAVIGMYAAIFPLFAYVLFGSSRQLITGPDAATCMMMAAALGPLAGGDPQRYLALVTIMTLIAGLFYFPAPATPLILRSTSTFCAEFTVAFREKGFYSDYRRSRLRAFSCTKIHF